MKKNLFIVLLLLMFIPCVCAKQYNESDIEDGSIIIGNHLFTVALNTKYAMLGATSIDSDKLDDMVIAYKYEDGVWADLITDEDIEMTFPYEILYVNGEKLPESTSIKFTNGGVVEDFKEVDMDIVVGQTISCDMLPTIDENMRFGWSFEGWALSSSEELFDFENTIITNEFLEENEGKLVFEPLWKPIEYHIIYSDNFTQSSFIDYYSHIEYPGKYSINENDVYCMFESANEEMDCKLKTYEELFPDRTYLKRVFMGWSPDGLQKSSFYSPEVSSKEEFIDIVRKNAVEVDDSYECKEGYVCMNVKLYAIWHNGIVWDYDKDDSEIRFADGYSAEDFQKSYQNLAGSKYGLIKYVALEKDGYVFDGWRDISTKPNFILKSDYDVSNNVSWVVPLHLVAQWREITPEQNENNNESE